MPRHPNALLFRQFIYRVDLITNRQILFVFGDNLERRGFGGQAKEMRGEPNAVGLPTKRSPDLFLTNADFDEVLLAAAPAMQRLLDQIENGGQVIWPRDGIGSGRAQLIRRAPVIAQFYAGFLSTLKQHAGA